MENQARGARSQLINPTSHNSSVFTGVLEIVLDIALLYIRFSARIFCNDRGRGFLFFLSFFSRMQMSNLGVSMGDS